MIPIQDQYLALFTAQELKEIEGQSLKILKARQHWSIEDACVSWLEAIIYQMLKKGLLRPLAIIELDNKKEA